METLERVGGYLEFASSIAWDYYRAGLQAPDIAAKMGIDARNVRTQAFWLNAIARKLGFECHKSLHHTTGLVRKPEQALHLLAVTGRARASRKPLRYTPQVHATMLRYRAAGLTLRQCAEKLNVSYGALTPAFCGCKKRNGNS